MDDKYVQMLTEAVQSAKSAHHRIDQINEVVKEIRADVKNKIKLQFLLKSLLWK